MRLPTFTTIAAFSLLALGCDRADPVVIVVPTTPPPLPVARTDTFETRVLGREIDAFDRTPSAEQHARVQKALAELDGEIAELEEQVAKKTGDGRAEAARKLTDLRSYRKGEQARFALLEAKAPLREIPETAAPPHGEGVGEKIGATLDKAARKVGEGVRDAADEVREKTR